VGVLADGSYADVTTLPNDGFRPCIKKFRCNGQRLFLADREPWQLHLVDRPAKVRYLNWRDGAPDPNRSPTVPESGRSRAYSITLSALISSDCGMVMPSALAVLRLITSSNVVGCSTGSSPGFAPLKILSTNAAARRNLAGRFCA